MFTEMGIILISFASFALFYTLRHIVSSSHTLTPPSVRLGGGVICWKWGNTANSLVHSFITGVGATHCFYFYPKIEIDVVNAYSPLLHGLTAFSIGYFVFDFFDMLLNHRKLSSYELMTHHVLVLSCLGLSMQTRLYLGFVMIALLIEVNSIFLHWRQLLIIYQIKKTSTYFRIISMLNLCTFLIFRFVPLGWMTSWLVRSSDQISPGVYYLGCVVNATIVVMSIVLLLRILNADFRRPNNTSQKTPK